MEDGIEQNRFTLNDKTEIMTYDNNYMYVCFPIENNGLIKNSANLIITYEKDKAINILKLNNYRVEIYKKNTSGLFLPSYDCLYVNKYSSSF